MSWACSPLISVVPGGYDPRISENVSCHKELCTLADSLRVSHTTLKGTTDAATLPSETSILFLLSIPAAIKSALLSSATLLVYTPAFEHFGIVPLESMLARRPVLAADKGGPTETVIDGQTGWLRNPDDVSEWSEVMEMAVREGNEGLLSDMGEKGRSRVIAEFSKAAMAQRLQETFDKMLAAKTRPAVMDDKEILISMGLVLVVFIFGTFLIALGLRNQLSIRIDQLGVRGGMKTEL
jgi:alpha-1,3/alpha-1,6-mannosyltransferase